MTDDLKPFDRSPGPSALPEGQTAPVPEAASADASPGGSAAPEPEALPTTPEPDAAALAASAAVMKFKSCRWRSDPEAGEFCTHRDVLPFAGKTAFNPESWCPECAFYKLRRTPKKRERDYSY